MSTALRCLVLSVNWLTRATAGYQKLAAATCNTVFWAGDIFAWKRKAPDGSGRGLSTFLQDAMCDAFAELAKRLDGCEAVLGFEVSGRHAKVRYSGQNN